MAERGVSLYHITHNVQIEKLPTFFTIISPLCLSSLTSNAVPWMPTSLLSEQFLSASDLQIQLIVVLGKVKEPKVNCDQHLSKALWWSVVTCV